MKRTILGLTLVLGLCAGVASTVWDRSQEASAIGVTCADQAEIYIGNMNPPKTIDGCQIALNHCLAFCTMANCGNNAALLAACQLSCRNHYGAGHCP